jgi:hypothetical protein
MKSSSTFPTSMKVLNKEDIPDPRLRPDGTIHLDFCLENHVKKGILPTAIMFSPPKDYFTN